MDLRRFPPIFLAKINGAIWNSASTTKHSTDYSNCLLPSYKILGRSIPWESRMQSKTWCILAKRIGKIIRNSLQNPHYFWFSYCKKLNFHFLCEKLPQITDSDSSLPEQFLAHEHSSHCDWKRVKYTLHCNNCVCNRVLFKINDERMIRIISLICWKTETKKNNIRFAVDIIFQWKALQNH